jgi:hypothetical protein
MINQSVHLLLDSSFLSLINQTPQANQGRQLAHGIGPRLYSKPIAANSTRTSGIGNVRVCIKLNNNNNNNNNRVYYSCTHLDTYHILVSTMLRA